MPILLRTQVKTSTKQLFRKQLTLKTAIICKLKRIVILTLKKSWMKVQKTKMEVLSSKIQEETLLNWQDGTMYQEIPLLPMTKYQREILLVEMWPLKMHLSRIKTQSYIITLSSWWPLDAQTMKSSETLRYTTTSSATIVIKRFSDSEKNLNLQKQRSAQLWPMI